MDSDDVLRGRILTRREVLSLLGAAGVAFIAACAGDDGGTSSEGSASTNAATSEATATRGASSGGVSQGATPGASTPVPSCVVVPELTEGPYFVDEKLDRSDIRSDPATGKVSEGVELTLTLKVASVADASCTTLAGALVDIWHCDALGVYSDVRDRGFNTEGQKFLRGYQTTDANGRVTFKTIYAGWYPGRATHIHFKVRKDNREFTSQLFFDDALSDDINDTLVPYSQKGSRGRTRNNADGIFRGSNGLLQLDVTKSGNAYIATFDIGMRA